MQGYLALASVFSPTLHPPVATTLRAENQIVFGAIFQLIFLQIGLHHGVNLNFEKENPIIIFTAKKSSVGL